jgi:hypothetical protein
MLQLFCGEPPQPVHETLRRVAARNTTEVFMVEHLGPRG